MSQRYSKREKIELIFTLVFIILIGVTPFVLSFAGNDEERNTCFAIGLIFGFPLIAVFGSATIARISVVFKKDEEKDVERTGCMKCADFSLCSAGEGGICPEITDLEKVLRIKE